MSFFAKPPAYRAFLLRMWEERSQDAKRAPNWHFSLEDSETGKRRGFADLQSLAGFLEEFARSSATTSEEATEPGRLARLVQSVKETLRPLSESELNLAAAGGSEPPAPAEEPVPDDDEPAMT